MATFSADLNSTAPGTAQLAGVFEGGDPEYSGYRLIRLTVDDTLIGDYNSIAAGGPSSVFAAQLTHDVFTSGLHSWTAVLGYYDSGEPVLTTYTASGTLNVPDIGHSDLYANSTWNRGVWWVWTSTGWHQCRAWIWDNGWKHGG